jgi:lysophospholipase L1-like esterase
MKKYKVYVIAITIAMITLSVLSCKNETAKQYGDPTIFEAAIFQFEKSDSLEFPDKNTIVVIGSSSIRGWHNTVEKDLAPLIIIPRGFGGSNMNDALHYTDRIVLPYKPRAVVIYEGDNDIAQGISPQQINDTFNEFVKIVHSELPKCRIYFLSIKPSISRWEMWSKMVKTNKLIENECANDSRLTYVDVATPMLNKQGMPKKEIFIADNLHMNSKGYEIWTKTLKPILLETELRYEEL